MTEVDPIYIRAWCLDYATRINRYQSAESVINDAAKFESYINPKPAASVIHLAAEGKKDEGT